MPLREPVITARERESYRQLYEGRMTGLVDIQPWWGVRDATNVSYTGHNTPATATSPPIPSAFQGAVSFSDVPCTVASTAGSTYSDTGGRSYALSGITVYVPTGFTHETLFPKQHSYNQLYYYGHFVFYQGRVWSIETISFEDEDPLVGILSCLEVPPEFDIPLPAKLSYLMDENWRFITDNTYERISA